MWIVLLNIWIIQFNGGVKETVCRIIEQYFFQFIRSKIVAFIIRLWYRSALFEDRFRANRAQCIKTETARMINDQIWNGWNIARKLSVFDVEIHMHTHLFAKFILSVCQPGFVLISIAFDENVVCTRDHVIHGVYTHIQLPQNEILWL